MNDAVKRRDFIKSLSLAGASFLVIDPANSLTFFPGNSKDEIKNLYFSASFDKKTGTIQIRNHDGSPFITNARTAANLNLRDKWFVTSESHPRVTAVPFTGPLGDGECLVIFCRDAKHKLDVEIQVSLYDNWNAITIESTFRNTGNENLTIKSLEPLRIVKGEGGTLVANGVLKCVTNGEMYYDAGTIQDFPTIHSLGSDDLKGVHPANLSIPGANGLIHSWWNAGLFSGYDKQGLAIGFLENNWGLGNLLIASDDGHSLSLLTESVFDPLVTLRPGQTIRSGRLMINRAPNPYAALEDFATAAGKTNKVRLPSILNGWCSWFYTLARVSEIEVVANTALAAQHLKPFGLEYIQVDEGYQRSHGDWEGNERFPHGMKWLATTIKSYGFKPGIWISPYVVTDRTPIFKEHPDWLLRHADGSLQRVGNWAAGDEPPANEDPKRYCVDITIPKAGQWLYDLIDTIVNDWGYEMIKIDFVAWSILAAERFHDPSASAAAVYRLGMEIMRKAAGDKCHILECGPGATTVGLIDSMRLEADVNYGFSEAAWDTYFTHPACSASAAGKRFYFHKRTWVNDVDHLCLTLLDNQQAEAAATIIALSGGNMISGDRLTELDPYKLEIIKKITPSFGEAARPVDLFDRQIQMVFALNIKKPFANWTIAGFFNPDLKEAVTYQYPLNRLWLEPGGTYLAFDFWKRQFSGEISKEIKLTVQPGTVTLLSLHEKTGHPQVISIDRHVMQGALELENVNWDESEKVFSGVSTGPLNSSHNVYVYVPEDHDWSWTDPYVLYTDHSSYSLKLVDHHIIQVHVRFEKSDRVAWEINMDEFFKPHS